MTDGPLIVFNVNGTIIGGTSTVESGTKPTLNLRWKSTPEFGKITRIKIYRGVINQNEKPVFNDTPFNLPVYSGSLYDGMGIWTDGEGIMSKSYYRIEVSTDKGHRAYTNPLWLEVLPPVVSLSVTPKWQGGPDPLIKRDDSIDLYTRVTNSTGGPLAGVAVTLSVRRASDNQLIYQVTKQTNSNGEATHSFLSVTQTGKYYAEAIVGSSYKRQMFYVVDATKLHPTIQIERNLLPFPVAGSWAPENIERPVRISFWDHSTVYDPNTGGPRFVWDISDNTNYTLDLIVTSEKSTLRPPEGSSFGFPANVTPLTNGFKMRVEIPGRPPSTGKLFNPRLMWFYKAQVGKYFMIETPDHIGNQIQDTIRIEEWLDGELVDVRGETFQIYPKTKQKRALLLLPDTDQNFMSTGWSDPYLTIIDQKGYDVDVKTFYTSSRWSHNTELYHPDVIYDRYNDEYIEPYYTSKKQYLSILNAEDASFYRYNYASLHAIDDVKGQLQLDLRNPATYNLFKNYDLIIMRYGYKFVEVGYLLPSDDYAGSGCTPEYIQENPAPDGGQCGPYSSYGRRKAYLSADVPYSRTGTWPHKNQEWQLDAPGLRQWLQEGGNLMLLDAIRNTNTTLGFNEWNISFFNIDASTNLENSNDVPSSIKSAWLAVQNVDPGSKATVATYGNGKILQIGYKSLPNQDFIKYKPSLSDVFSFFNPNSMHHAVFLDEAIRWLARDPFVSTPTTVSFVLGSSTPSIQEIQAQDFSIKALEQSSRNIHIIGYLEGAPRAHIRGSVGEKISATIPSGLYNFYIYADGYWPKGMGNVEVAPSGSTTITIPSLEPLSVDLGVATIHTSADPLTKRGNIKVNVTNYGFQDVINAEILLRLQPVGEAQEILNLSNTSDQPLTFGADDGVLKMIRSLSLSAGETQTLIYNVDLGKYIGENQTRADFKVTVETSITFDYLNPQFDLNFYNNELSTELTWYKFSPPLIINPLPTSLYFSRAKNGYIYAYPGENLKDFIGGFVVTDSSGEYVTDADLRLDVEHNDAPFWTWTPDSNLSLDLLVFAPRNYTLTLTASKHGYKTGLLHLTFKVYDPMVIGHLNTDEFTVGDTVHLTARVYDRETWNVLSDVDVEVEIAGTTISLARGSAGEFYGTYKADTVGDFNAIFSVKRDSMVLDEYVAGFRVHSKETYPYYVSWYQNKYSFTRPDSVTFTVYIMDRYGNRIPDRNLRIRAYTTKKDGTKVIKDTVLQQVNIWRYKCEWDGRRYVCTTIFDGYYSGYLYMNSPTDPPASWTLELYDGSYSTPIRRSSLYVYADVSAELRLSPARETYYRDEYLEIHHKELYDNGLKSYIPPNEPDDAYVELRYPNGSTELLYQGAFYALYAVYGVKPGPDLLFDHFETGRYQIRSRVGYYGRDYYAAKEFTVHGKSNLKAELLWENVPVGYPLVVFARLFDEYNLSIRGAVVNATVEQLGISALLSDDGAHLDGMAGDGVYAGMINIPESAVLGSYRVAIEATSPYYTSSNASLFFTVTPPSPGRLVIADAPERRAVLLGESINVTLKADNVGDLPLDVQVDVGGGKVEILEAPGATFKLEGRESRLLTWRLRPLERGEQSRSFVFTTPSQSETSTLTLDVLRGAEINVVYEGEISTAPYENFTVNASLANSGDVNALGVVRLVSPPEIEAFGVTELALNFTGEKMVSWSLRALDSGVFTVGIQVIEESGRFTVYPVRISSVSDRTPPVVQGVWHEPVLASGNDTVTVYAMVSDESDIAVTLSYTSDGVSWVEKEMSPNSSYQSTTAMDSDISTSISSVQKNENKGKRKIREKEPGGKGELKKVVVKLREGKEIPSKALEKLGGKKVRGIKKLGFEVIETYDPDAFISNIKKYPEVIDAQEAVSYRALSMDSYYPEQWNLRNVKVEGAWNLTQGDGVVVAVLDTGVDYTHRDLDANYVGGYDWVNGDPDPMDDNGHGTHVAGIIAAENDGVGVVGVASRAKILAEKVLDSSGVGYDYQVAEAIIHATDQGADVISMSLGGGYSRVIDEASEYAYRNGVLLVAAAGNNGGGVLYPAALDTVIAVSSVGSDDTFSTFSSWGPDIELAAPGGGDKYILSTYLDNSYARKMGTSMAAAHVSGMAALLKSLYRNHSNVDIRGFMHSATQDLGAPGRDVYYGYGLVDASRILEVGGGSSVINASVSGGSLNLPLNIQNAGVYYAEIGPFVVERVYYKISAVDSYGNSVTDDNNGSYYNITIDPIPPEINITSPINNSYLAARTIVTEWNASDNFGIDYFEIFLDGILLGNISEANKTLANLSEGSHVVEVKAVDFVNYSAIDLVSFIIDTISPLISVTGVANGSYYSTDVSANVAIFDANLNSTLVLLDGALYANETPISDEGIHVLNVYADDKSGNNASKSIIFVLDKTSPEVNITSPANGSYVKQIVDITGFVDDPNLDKFSLSIDGKETSNFLPYSWNTVSYSDAPHVIEVKASDKANNSASASIGVIVDNTPPTIIVSSPLAQKYSYTQDITIDFNATNGISGVVSVSANLDGTPVADGQVIDLFNFSLGEHAFTVTAVDNVGNNASKTVIFRVIDDVPPVSSDNADREWHNSDIVIAITARDEKSAVKEIHYAVNQGAEVVVAGSAANATISYEDDNNTIRYYAVDEWGNAEAPRLVDGIRLDKTPPMVRLWLDPGKDEYYSDEGLPVKYAAYDPVVQGTPSNNLTFIFVIDNTIVEDPTNIANFVGTHTLTLTAIDKAGNKASASLSFTVVLKAEVNVDPDTLNLKSEGRWVTAYIEFPLQYNPLSIKISSVTLSGIAAESDPRYDFVSNPVLVDKDADGLPEFVVKFDRSAVQDILEPSDAVNLSVRGEFSAGIFEGSDSIRVIDEGSNRSSNKTALMLNKHVERRDGKDNQVRVRIDLFTVGNNIVDSVLVQEYIPEELGRDTTDGVFADHGLMWDVGTIEQGEKQSVEYTLIIQRVEVPATYQLRTVVEYQTADDLERIEEITYLIVEPDGQVKLKEGYSKSAVKEKGGGYTRGTMGRHYDRGGSGESHGRGHGRPENPGRGNPPDSPPGNPNPGPPDNHTQPENPGNPNQPGNPAQPNNPNPGNPNPGQPNHPGQPDNPGNPNRPDNPGNPPENPGNPGNPGNGNPGGDNDRGDDGGSGRGDDGNREGYQNR